MQNKARKTNKFKLQVRLLSAGLFIAFLPLFFSHKALASDINADKVVQLVNSAREQAQIGDLTVNPLLKAAAEKKAQDMIDHDYFAHISPTGKSPWDFIMEQGYDYRWAGENLAINFTSVQDQQQAWMQSPLHRKNILNENYKETGVAVKVGIIDGHETTITVQEFGTQMSQAYPVIASSNQILPKNQLVAGLSTASQVKAKSVQMENAFKSSAFLQDDTLTPLGWLAVFMVAILMVIVDLFKIFHKKRDRLLLLHGAINSH